jgi:predicted AAA+ superfamily ATPase
VSLTYRTNDRNTSEIDFLLDAENQIIPLEVKAEVNLQSKSLRAFKDKYNPKISIRSSMSDYKRESWLINLPLYAIGNVADCLKSNL